MRDPTRSSVVRYCPVVGHNVVVEFSYSDGLHLSRGPGSGAHCREEAACGACRNASLQAGSDSRPDTGLR